ncbi:MAG: glycosyltransferase [Thiotrichaceae bacterium]
MKIIVTGILQHTDYPQLELIIVDNGSVAMETLTYLQQLQQDSRIIVLRHDAEFNYSQLNNLAVTHAHGEVLALLNNDLEIIHRDWLKEMVSHALRPEIGAVGAKLYYSNNMIQHAGVIVGLGGLAGHNFKFLPKQFTGYYWKPFLTQNYSAVTGACLVLRKQVYDAVGGLNEKQLKVAFNDVDLCLKIGALGYRIIWTPYAELYHHESVSRGADLTVRKYLRLQSEIRYMQTQWATQLAADPFYNPNLTIQFEDFSLAYPPRVDNLGLNHNLFNQSDVSN